VKVNESDFMLTRVSRFGFAVPYNFSIPLTCGFAFGQCKNVFLCGIYILIYMSGGKHILRPIQKWDIPWYIDGFVLVL